MKGRDRVVVFCAALVVTVSAFADEPAKEFSNIVNCTMGKSVTDPTHPDDNKPKCVENLSVSGAELSTIIITGIESETANVVFSPGEGQRVVIAKPCMGKDGKAKKCEPSDELKPCDAPGKTFKIVVQKNRHFLPVWIARAGRDVQQRFQKTTDDFTPTCDNPRFVIDAITPDLSFSVNDKAFTVPVRNQKWWLESGGFYAYSWARDEQLVTQNLTDEKGKSTIRVVERRNGDRIGPSTGVTFVFHPGDFPEYGWEFGTSTANSKTNYYLGGTLRLIQFNDRALLTIGGGVSHVSVTQFPSIDTTKVYEPDDPLLTGRTKYVNRPYVSLGLGINFGGPSQSKNATP